MIEGNRRLIHDRSVVVDLTIQGFPLDRCQKWMFQASWRGRDVYSREVHEVAKNGDTQIREGPTWWTEAFSPGCLCQIRVGPAPGTASLQS